MSEIASASFAASADSTSQLAAASAFRLRGATRLAGLFWFFWVLLSLVLTRRAYQEHFAHFEGQSILLLVVATVTACVVVHILLRRALVQKTALPLLAGTTVVGLVVFEPLALIVTSSVFLASYGLGRFVRERLGLAVEPGAQEIALSTGLGLALSTWGLFWLGLASLYQAPVFMALLVAALVVFRREIQGLWESCQCLQAAAISVLGQKDGAASVALVFGAAQVLIGLLVVLTPALDADFLAFHLPLTRFYAAEHALTPLPTLDYTYFPQGVEVLMTFGHMLAGQPADRMIPPIFFVLLLLLIPAMARELGLSDRDAALAIMFVAGLPFLHRTAVFAKNDPALALFQLSALICYFRSRRDPEGSWLRLGAIFLAASFAVKHVALFGAIPIGILYLRQLRRHPRPFREAVILAGLFALIALPWHARTFLDKGNPVYPGAVRYAASVLKSGDQAPAGRSKIGYFLIPLAVLFQGEFFFESHSSNPLGILFIVLFGAWLVVRRREKSRVERACLLFVLAYYLYWGAIWPVIRYAIVPILLLALMTSGRLRALRDKGGKVARILAVSVWAYGLFFALLVTLILEVKPGMMGYLVGEVSESQYLETNDRRYASLAFLSQTAGPRDMIYSVWNCATGLAPDPALFRCSPPISPEKSKESMFEALREQPYQFLVLPTPLQSEDWFDGLAGQYEFTRIHSDEAFSVYRLRRI